MMKVCRIRVTNELFHANFKDYFGKSVVTPVNAIKINQGKQIFLKQNFSSSNFGICAAQ